MAKQQKKSGSSNKAASHSSISDAGEIDLGRLEELMKLMNRHQVSELEWEDQQGRIMLRTGASGGSSARSIAAPAHEAMTATSAHPARSEAPAAAPKAAQAPANQKQVPSPFVGTFYRQARPGSDPYVREGQTVKRGDVLCIIEAMKLMNEIESEHNGKIISILVENGQAVEFGEPLFVIET